MKRIVLYCRSALSSLTRSLEKAGYCVFEAIAFSEVLHLCEHERIVSSLLPMLEMRLREKSRYIKSLCVSVPALLLLTSSGSYLTYWVLAAIADANQNPLPFLFRHAAGDWCQLDQFDMRANAEALKRDSRILSAYVLPTGVKMWIITEAEDDAGNREATTILLSSEYDHFTRWAASCAKNSALRCLSSRNQDMRRKASR